MSQQKQRNNGDDNLSQRRLFENDFPSLRGKELGSFKKDGFEIKYFGAGNIWDKCLDKAKVKQAIEKVAIKLRADGEDIYFAGLLWNELGLKE